MVKFCLALAANIYSKRLTIMCSDDRDRFRHLRNNNNV